MLKNHSWLVGFLATNNSIGVKISSLPAFTNESAAVHNNVWTFLDPVGAMCKNSKTLIIAWVARRPSELILKFRRDEPSKTSYLYGNEHTIMT